MAIERGQVEPGSMLIVESLDRLSREPPLDALDQMRAIVKAGVEIVTLADGQRYGLRSLRQGLEQLLVALVRMSTAHGELEQKSQRVREAWMEKKRRAAEQREALTKGGVGWCRIENKRYVPIPERADMVRRIFRELANGVGHSAIATRLNRDGIATWGRSHGWYPSYVKKILSNRAVLGFYQPHRKLHGRRVPEGDEIAGYYPQVVDNDLFWSAQAAASKRRVGGGGPRGKKISNLFSHIAKCGCGRPMIHINKGSNRDKVQRYLVCDAVRRGLECTTPGSRWWPYLSTEFAILGCVIAEGIAPLDSDTQSTIADLREQRARAQVQLDQMESRRDRLLDAFGDVEDDGVARKIRETAAEIIRLKGVCRDLEATIEKTSSLQGVRAAWADILKQLAERRRIAKQTDEYAFRAKVAQEIARVIRELRFTATTVAAITHDGDHYHLFHTVPKSRERRRRGQPRPAPAGPSAHYDDVGRAASVIDTDIDAEAAAGNARHRRGGDPSGADNPVVDTERE